jgi:hypothetical protein
VGAEKQNYFSEKISWVWICVTDWIYSSNCNWTEFNRIKPDSNRIRTFRNIHSVSPVIRKHARVAAGTAGERPPPRGIATASGRTPADIHRVTFPFSTGSLMGGKIGSVRIFRSGAANRWHKTSPIEFPLFLVAGTGWCTWKRDGSRTMVFW